MELARDGLIRVAAFGDSFPKLDLTLLRDDLANHSRGYGVASEPANCLAEHQNHLLRSVLSTPALRRRFFLRVDRGHTVANHSECIKFLEDLGEVMLLVSSCILTCCGQPCRGTELAGFSPVNTEHGVRNVLVKDGRVLLFQLRQKTQSVTGHYEVCAMS